MAKDKKNAKKLGEAAVKVHFFSSDNERIDFRSARIYQVVAESGGVKSYLWELIHSKRALSIVILIVVFFSFVARPLGVVVLDLFRERDSDTIFAVEGDAGTTLYNGEKIDVGTATAINIGIDESSRFTKVSVGPTHTLAIDKDGNLFAWGSDEYGQIGDGISEAAHTTDCDSGDCIISPINLSIITGVDYPNILYGKTIVDVSAGSTHSLALDDEGNLYAWGDNRDGQIGDGSATLNHHGDKVLAPVHIRIIDPSSRVRRPATAISAAEYFSTAVDDIGNFYTWGRNADHELGDNSTESSSEPVALTRDRANPLHGKKVVEVRATRSHTTVTTENDQTYTWGKSDYQIPIPVETNADTTDTTSIDTADDSIISEVKKDSDIEIPKDTEQLSVSDDSGAVVTKSGDLFTWGEGAIGDACTTYMPTAVKINGLATEKLPCNTILISNEAETSEKTVSLTTLARPATNILTQPGAININSVKPSEITVGEEKVVVISGSGFVPGNISIAKISANYHHSMAVDSAGNLYVWGLNEHSEIGTGNTTSATTPVKITGHSSASKNDITASTRISEVAAGVYFSLAVDTGGRLYSWGYNNKGQLGIGSTSTTRAPRLVNGNGSIGSGTFISSIAAGYYHALAIDSSGTIHTWGDNTDSQLGNGSSGGTSKVPAIISIGSQAKLVAAGNRFSVAVSTSGQVYSWGKNTSSSVSPDKGVVNTPRQVSGGDLPSDADIISVAAGNAHTVVADSSGNVYAWGAGAVGQIGTGVKSATPYPSRVNGHGQLPAASSVKKVAAGTGNSFAIDSSGKLYSWGSNIYGVPGMGTIGGDDVSVPKIINGNNSGAQNDISSGMRIVDITSGSSAIHAIAISSSGALYAWGNDNFNQIGDNRTIVSSSKDSVYNVAAPRQISGFGAFASASAPVSVSLDGSSISADITSDSISFTTSSSTPKTSKVTVSNGSSSDSANISFIEKTVAPPSNPDPEKPVIIPPTAEEKPVIEIPKLPTPPSSGNNSSNSNGSSGSSNSGNSGSSNSSNNSNSSDGSGGDSGSSGNSGDSGGSNSEEPDYSDPKWTFTSTEQRVGISPILDKGYRLYLSSTTPVLKAKGLPDISPISGTLDNPSTLDLATWGFALSHKDIYVPANNFDDSYSPQTPKNRYAGIPTTPLLVYDSPDPTAVIRLYYGIRAKEPGTDISKYTATITFTIISH